MNTPDLHNSGLELLAPAGTLEVFATAVDEGADAIYIGAPAFNARAQARHFNLEEVAAMIDYGHRHKVKVYLAMNSLMKEDEIPAALELLGVLKGLAPDAIILQDLGLYHLCRRFCPELPLHASTLMTVHNSLGVKQCAEMGFKRVVLAREMTLAEIREAGRKAGGVELEVFVHGALCFSASGLCLFSSYLGGMSGLRGRCVQPCRRRYHWQGRGKKVTSGYFFSMNDLEGAPFIPDLKASGVKSIKIEGRMKSSRYVAPVVRAYRMLIDAGDDFPEALPQARDLLRQAMSRRTSPGYFPSAQPNQAFKPNQSGNIGVFLGKINKVHGANGLLVLKKSLKEGDRLRLHQEKRGERKAFTLKVMQKNRRKCRTARAGDTVEIRLPVPGTLGDSIYKVDTRERKEDRVRSSKIVPGRFNKKVRQLENRVNVASLVKDLGLKFDVKGGAGEPGGRRQKTGHGKKPPLILKSAGLQVLRLNLPKQIKSIVVVLDEENFKRFQEIRGRGGFADRLIWALPPLIFEDRLEFYREAAAVLIDMGFKNWQISNLGQLQIFNDRSGLKISGDYRLNILNSQGLRVLEALGLQEGEVLVETDADNLAGILRNKKGGIRTGLTVFGKPPLFTARPSPDFLRFGPAFVSPRGESFRLIKKWDVTLALAEKPFSLLKDLASKPLNRLDYAVVDFTCHRHGKKEIMDIFQNDKGRKGQKELSSFNFWVNLK